MARLRLPADLRGGLGGLRRLDVVLRGWLTRGGPVSSGGHVLLRGRVPVVLAGLVVVVLLGVIGSCSAGGRPAADASSPPPPASSASPSASPSPSTSPKPSAKPKPASTKPPAGSIMIHTGTAATALTFDDGPQPTWTPNVLNQLKAAGVHATFCLIGQQVKANAALVRRMVAEGHTLCNHSWAHDEHLGSKSTAQIRADIVRTDAAIHAVVPGVPILYFRQPGGIWTANEIAVIRSLGKKALGWSVDPSDWDRPGTQAIISRVLSHTRKGSIVLMHDGGGDRSQTASALHTILPALKAKYTLIALPTPTG
ncbi:polysaccharide deacetylase family protein [Hamadaea tsunoensis]|uniref:polysaccharide deacetylase family protein n=1 Tax=Hamadaea tsunoensis TaxID=53368 RepID=UPI0006873094|nr:polysaccharide deacetylase family protein [Hamadaea tsunoensis]